MCNLWISEHALLRIQSPRSLIKNTFCVFIQFLSFVATGVSVLFFFWGFQITFRYMSLRLLWKEIGLLQGPLTDNTQHERDRYSCLGVIRTLNPNMRAVADPRCRPCSHWDRCFSVTLSENIWCPWSSYSVMRVIRVSFSSSSNVVPAVRIR